MKEMEHQARVLVYEYIRDNLTAPEEDPAVQVEIIWHCKIYGCHRFVLTASMDDTMQFEATYIPSKSEWQLKVYKEYDTRTVIV